MLPTGELTGQLSAITSLADGTPLEGLLSNLPV
jgi:hypothetical protein